MLVARSFSRSPKPAIMRQLIVREIDNLGIGSLFIVCIISFFMGAVISIQMAAQIDTPLIPMYTVGYGTRETVILEFSPTVIALILAGKVGSNVASEIGTMRVTEQIDALEIMGVNSANYLVLPKIIASVLINPILTIISMALGIFGGYLACTLTGLLDATTYLYGATLDFKTFHLVYALIKSFVFAFIISSISAYRGYYVDGGSQEVGQASTRAVVNSSISILLWNFILTRLLLL
ncbi:MAG: ABC transporter permease [Candidatus Competibacteraceae bacterium]|nr:ABC transporter permease [Candidatus Competibacteraceae bacterium]